MAENLPPTEAPPADDSPQAPAMQVATVFEDGTAARCAQRLIGRILRMSGCDLPVQEVAWGFDVLQQPTGMASAARQANAADVLVIAAWHDTQALQRVAEWLQHWLAPRREKGGALVCISIDRPETTHTFVPLEERLAHIARQIGMDFFSTHVPAAAAILPYEHVPLSPHELHLQPGHFLAPDDPARAHRR